MNNVYDDAWWEEVPEAEKERDAERTRRRKERATKRARSGCLITLFLLFLAAAVLFCIFLLQDMPTSPIFPEPLPEEPTGEETTMHIIQVDWRENIVTCVLHGDEYAGSSAAEMGGLSYTYDDLLLLAKIIEKEAGVDWPDLPIIALANVVQNRAASPLFPDTIRGVLYARNPIQYEPVYTSEWEDFLPSERYVRLAQRALEGERVIGEDVVWQALFPQGSVTIMTWYDKALDSTTYFCEG